jgi:hypothetical protein
MEQLLELFKHIAENPDIDLDDMFCLKEFEGVYWYYNKYRGIKPGFCPTCNEQKPLTKHHIIPRHNGGKGLLDNHFYICRECHDYVHGMLSKVEKIENYMEENPDASEEELQKLFNADKETIIQVFYPDYYLKCKIKHQMRIEKKVYHGIQHLDHKAPVA